VKYRDIKIKPSKVFTWIKYLSSEVRHLKTSERISRASQRI